MRCAHHVPLMHLSTYILPVPQTAHCCFQPNLRFGLRSFGNEGTDNGGKLNAFIEAVNSSDNSHLVTVPAGTILSDQLFGSPIYQHDGGAGYAAGGGGAGGGEVLLLGSPAAQVLQWLRILTWCCGE